MHNQKGNTLLGVLIGIILVLAIGGAYYLITQKKSNTQTSQVTNSIINTPQPKPTNSNTPIDPYSDWKTYTSTKEKVSFKYPANWAQVTVGQQTNVPNADTFTLQSPSGKVNVSWISAITGLGGGCSDQCPTFTVIDKTMIKGAPNLYVVSGIKSSDNKIFEPWLAVQDDKGIITTQQTMGYDTFMGRNNGDGSKTGNMYAIFATSLIYASGPKLSEIDAKAYFDKPEVKQAKLILLSLTY
jgi:hypothetical protein